MLNYNKELQLNNLRLIDVCINKINCVVCSHSVEL